VDIRQPHCPVRSGHFPLLPPLWSLYDYGDYDYGDYDYGDYEGIEASATEEYVYICMCAHIHEWECVMCCTCNSVSTVRVCMYINDSTCVM
jgi:hypothetical protein